MEFQPVLIRLTEKDIGVLFYDSLAPVMKSLRQFDPISVSAIPQIYAPAKIIDHPYTDDLDIEEDTMPGGR